MAENSNNNFITIGAVIIALASVAYATVLQVKNNETSYSPAKTNVVAEDNPVVMTIDGQDVTRLDVLDNFNESGSQLPAGTDLENVFPLLQEQYLMTQLLEKGAKENGVTSKTPEVAQRVSKALSQARRAVFMEQVGQAAITDEALQGMYETFVVNVPDVKERHARHILLEDEAKALAMIIKLNNGADFTKLAEEYSVGPTAKDGGDLGYFTKNEMVPAFAEAAFLIPVGKVGQEPVKTQFGYHVVKVEDERVREKPTFDEIKPQLEQQLRQQAIRQEIQSLRDATDVTLLDIEGNPVVNAQDMSGQEPEDFTASDEVVDEPAEEVMEETIEDQVDDSSNEEEALENEGEETLEMDAAE